MIQGAGDNSEDEESEDEVDGEEFEGKVSYFLIFIINCGALSERVQWSVIKNHSRLGESAGEEEGEEEGDDDAEEDLKKEVGETPGVSQDKEHPEKTNGDVEENEKEEMEGEFTDEKNEGAFCLETNLPAEGEENMGEQEQEEGELFS